MARKNSAANKKPNFGLKTITKLLNYFKRQRQRIILNANRITLNANYFKPFKRPPHKLNHFVGLALKGLKQMEE